MSGAGADKPADRDDKIAVLAWTEKAARQPDQGPDEKEKEKAKEREGKEETGRQQRAKKERRL